MLKSIKAIWSSVRGGGHEAELARWRVELLKKKPREAEEQRIREYEAHVGAVDLNGIATRRHIPLSISEILEEVQKRFQLAAVVNRDRDINLVVAMTDKDIEAVTGKLDQTALHWLLEHGDPKRQRDAAKMLLDARANITPHPSLASYATAVAEAAARSRDYQYERSRTGAAVAARAILLRSASGRWDRLKGEPIPLSEAL